MPAHGVQLYNDLDALFLISDGTALDVLDLQLFETLKNTVHQNDEIAADIDSLIVDFASGIGSKSPDAGLSKLTRLKEDIESRLISRLCDRSVPFALTFFRSILALNPAEKFGSPGDFARIVRIIDLAICRYCRYAVDDIVFDEKGVWGIRVTNGDVRAMLEAARLAQLLGTCQVDLRRLAYGGTLLSAEGSWIVELDPDVQRLSEIHDVRLGRYGNLFRHAGIPGQDSLPLGRGKYWIMLGGKNEHRWVWCGRRKEHVQADSVEAVSMVGPDDSYVPTFMLGEFSLDSYVETLKMFERAMIERGFNLDVALALLSALAALGEELYVTLRPGHRLRSLGFTIASRNDVVLRVMESLKESNIESTEEAVNRGIDFIARDAGSATQVSFNDSGGLRNLVDLGGDHLLIDYLTSFSGVRRLFDIVAAVEGSDANARGASFEHYVAARLLNAIPLAKAVWVSRQLTFADGEIRDVDVGILIGPLLVLCECKARTQRMKVDGITSAQITRLAAQHKADLNQVDSLGRSLSTKLLRGPKPLSSRVKRIIPCVVTTSVEWVGSTDPVMWLVRGITPRVCTVEELIDVLVVVTSGSASGISNEMTVCMA